jgi:hypothetical protein
MPTGRHLLGRGHLPMRRGCRVAGEGLGIAQIDQALEQFQRVVEAHARCHAAANLKSQQ